MKNAFLLMAATLSAGAVLLAAPKSAHAIGPVDVEVAARVGYATSPSSESGAINPMGFGLGGRGGVSFFGFYGGVSAMYYFGGSQDGASANTTMVGFDLGYNFKLPFFLTIRPQIGIGNWTTNVSGSTTGSTSNLYLEPGIVAQAGIGTFFVAVDANAMFLPGYNPCDVNGVTAPACTNNTQASFTIHGQFGIKF